LTYCPDKDIHMSICFVAYYFYQIHNFWSLVNVDVPWSNHITLTNMRLSTDYSKGLLFTLFWIWTFVTFLS